MRSIFRLNCLGGMRLDTGWLKNRPVCCMYSTCVLFSLLAGSAAWLSASPCLAFTSFLFRLISGTAVQRARAHKGPLDVGQPTRKCHALHALHAGRALQRIAHTLMNWLRQAP